MGRYRNFYLRHIYAIFTATYVFLGCASTSCQNADLESSQRPENITAALRLIAIREIVHAHPEKFRAVLNRKDPSTAEFYEVLKELSWYSDKELNIDPTLPKKNDFKLGFYPDGHVAVVAYNHCAYWDEFVNNMMSCDILSIKDKISGRCVYVTDYLDSGNPVGIPIVLVLRIQE